MSWYERPIDRRAAPGGELGVNDRPYRGGQFMPFYVPRLEMPQIDEEDYPEFFAFCEGKTELFHRIMSPWVLKPHQIVDKFKAEAMPDSVRAKPVLVSRDDYVLDGNHRWMAHALLKEKMPVIQLDLEFEPAIALMFSFPKTYTITRDLQ